MAVHPEYNDRFWRYVRDLRAVGPGAIRVLPLGENLWQIETQGGEATVSYRIELPAENPENRAAWHSTLRRDGAAFNPVDTFIYLADYPRAQSAMTFRGPGSWRHEVPLRSSRPAITTAGVSYEGTAETLLDAPMLLGSLRHWDFDIRGTRHRVAYWPLPTATPFDTTAFVDAIAKLARETVNVFGVIPYPSYTFQLQDGAWGALEHANAVTIGMPSRDLASDPRAYLGELAHEFFHTWNLVRLYPEGRGAVSYQAPAHATGLWLSEGITIYYAEALTRRAGFPERGMTRKDLLAEEMESYYGSPGNTLISPEVASARAVDTTGINGDYGPDYYTQGRLIGTVLDIIIRDSTRNARGLDDFMRAMYSRFALKRGFTGADVERTASDVCACDLHSFFENHVRGSRPIEFNKYLASVGLRAVVDTIPATDSAGRALPDLRVWAYPPKAGGRMRVMIQNPSSVWARAGLHTGTELISFNRLAIDSFPDFRRAVRAIRLGEDVPVEVSRNGGRETVTVRVGGYDRVRVRVETLPDLTSSQRERQHRWSSASPN